MGSEVKKRRATSEPSKSSQNESYNCTYIFHGTSDLHSALIKLIGATRELDNETL